MRFNNLAAFGFGIILLGLILRLTNLTSLPVFADESIYIRWSQVMRAEATLRFLPLSDGKQPLFMWLVIPALKFIADPLVAGRLVSAFAGIGTLVGVGLAAYLLFHNRRIALTTGVLWAVSPYAVFFDRLALADSLLTMFVVWTFVFAHLALSRLRWDFSMLAGFTLGFAHLTKSPAIFAYALLPLSLVYVPWTQLKGFKKLIPAGLLLTTYLLSFSMYNILRLGPEFHQIALRNADYLHPISEILIHPLDPLTSHLRDFIDFFVRLLTPFGFVFALLGLYEGGKRHLSSRLVLSAWWLIPIIIQSAVAVSFTARYLLFTVPFSVILISHGLWHLGDRTKKHFLSLGGLLLVILTCLIFDYLLIFSPTLAPLPRIERSGYLEEWTAGHGIRKVADHIRQAAVSGPVVVGSEGFFGTPFSALQMYLNDLPQVRVVGIGQNVTSLSQDLKNALADNQVFLVINSTRLLVNPQSLGLDLLQSYPKAQRPDGSQEFLLFMRLPK